MSFDLYFNFSSCIVVILHIPWSGHLYFLFYELQDFVKLLFFSNSASSIRAAQGWGWVQNNNRTKKRKAGLEEEESYSPHLFRRHTSCVCYLQMHLNVHFFKAVELNIRFILLFEIKVKVTSIVFLFTIIMVWIVSHVIELTF